MENPRIMFKGVDLQCYDKVIAENINFSWNEGEFVYLIGKVGEGKTTLLKTIYHALPLSEGEALVLNYKLQELKSEELVALRSQIGLSFQNCEMLEDRDVYSNLYFCLKALGWGDDQIAERRVKEVIELLGLRGLENRLLNSISEGEKQKLAIARAIVHCPPIVIVDEPTKNLDVETIKLVMQILHSQASEKKSLVIMATHNLQVIRNFPGKVYLLNNKKVIDVTQRFYSKKGVE